MKTTLLIILCLIFTPSILEANSLTGKASVIDGDSISIKGKTLEMVGYYAPRMQDQCALWKGKKGIQRGVKPDHVEFMGKTAKSFLSNLIKNKPLTCEVRKGNLALCLLDGKPIYEHMFKAGLGWQRETRIYKEHSEKIRKLFWTAKKKEIGVFSFSYCKNPSVFHAMDARKKTGDNIERQIQEGKKIIRVN